jgi:hypothetical protein
VRGDVSDKPCFVWTDIPVMCHLERGVDVATDGPYREIAEFQHLRLTELRGAGQQHSHQEHTRQRPSFSRMGTSAALCCPELQLAASRTNDSANLPRR